MGFVYRNPGWHETSLLPLPGEQRSLRENIIHPDDYPRVMAVFDDYLQRRSPHYQIEYRCRKKTALTCGSKTVATSLRATSMTQ